MITAMARKLITVTKRIQRLVCGKMIGVSYYSSKNQNAINITHRHESNGTS